LSPISNQPAASLLIVDLRRNRCGVIHRSRRDAPVHFDPGGSNAPVGKPVAPDINRACPALK
jgi:hypothetical protein